MHSSLTKKKTASGLYVFLLLTVVVCSAFFAQEPQPSPTPESSPTPTPTSSPRPSPSPTPLPGAQNFHQWGSVTVFNGLPSDSVRAISQTSDGVMWFGTDNGLARFDGRRVQNYSPGGSGTDRILSLHANESGGIWIGTQAGAFVYSDNGFHLVVGTKDLGINSILIGSEVFLGTDTGLILRVEGDSIANYSAVNIANTPISSSDGSSVAVTSLIEIDGTVFAATSGEGVFSIDDTQTIERSGKRTPLFVNSLARNENGKLWLGSDAAAGRSGLYQEVRDSDFARLAVPTSRVLALQNNDSGLWAGTERFGLFHFADSKVKKAYTFENTSGGLRSNTIFTLFTDREGVLWIGTNRGVSRFDRLGASQETISSIANSNFIRSLFRASDGSVYAGSNRGLFKQIVDKWTAEPSQGNKPIFAISEDRSRKLIVGTIDRSGGEKVSAKESGTWSFADFKGEKYAAVNGLGLVQLRSGGNTVKFNEPAISCLRAVGEKLYIGTTDKGLLSFDGQTIKNEIEPDLLKSGTIWKLFSEADDALWIAGQHGVFRVRDGQVEKAIDAEDVRDVFVDGEQIWAATTTRGLLQARHDERFGWLVSTVGFEQGLPSEKAFAILPVEDGVLVATNRGVVTYRRGSVAPKLIPTRLLSQRVHDLSEIRSTIPLEYPQNSLLIDVAGQSSRTFPEEFQYAFILKNSKGEELERRISNDSQYTPSDLSPGEYLVEAIALNRDLVASNALEIRFAVSEAPFPWTATALGVLLVIALFGLAWAFIANRRVYIRNRELAAAKLDLANEAEAERRRIARDLHDQTLADLRSLILLSDSSTHKIAGFRDEIEAISGEVRRICEDLSPSVLENVGLVAALEFLLDRTIKKHKFMADENLDERLWFPMSVQLQVYRIAQEVLTNIKTHSDADTVGMSLQYSDAAFDLVISDNGALFKPEEATSTGRGIANIRARASMIGSKISWGESGQGGNRFSLRIPK